MLLVLAAGCAPAVQRPRPGYDRMLDSLGAVDGSGLAGKRIVLDAGHGGFFRGSKGVKGLAEADVNLGVTLKLRELLVARGALVLLTRDTDRDFLTPADSTLRADLAERVRLANAFAPDLFVSIHHNADAGGRHDVNETQTYYKLGDEGASLDVAQDLHRALVRNVGIPIQNVYPGNYFVLRNVDAPAVLTETSYITYPPVEQRLKLPEKQAIEAQSLYLGIARYFGRPIPAVVDVAVLDPRTGTRDTVFAEGPRIVAEIEGAWDRAELVVDGDRVPFLRRDTRIEWSPTRPLAAGEHQARLRVRRTGAGAARDRQIAFRIARPAARLSLSTIPARAPAAGGEVGIRVLVLDPVGHNFLDSTLVRVTAILAPDVLLDTVVTARDGAAWAYVRTPARTSATDTTRRTGAKRRPVGSDHLGIRAALVAAPAVGDSLDLSRDGSHWSGFVRLMPAGRPLAGAMGTREPSPDLAWINRDGFAVLAPETAPPLDSTRRARAPALAGYRAWAEGDLPSFTPIAGGALHGRRIVLDPDGGGDNSGGMGTGGTRAAVLNLDVARALASLLEAAGARVRLTRDADISLSELARVQISEAFGAERYLRIGHRREPPQIGYYFSSPAGRAWAARVAAACSSLGLPVPPRGENAQYPLQQTSCPALYAGLARIDDPAAEARMLEAGAVGRVAQALYFALVREWAPDLVAPVDSIEVRDPSTTPVPGVAIRLGNALHLETDPGGRARFFRTEPGPLEVDARHERIRIRRTLLDSERGTVLTGSQGP